MKTANRLIVAAQPLNVSYKSPYQQLKQIYTYSISATITGTPNGTIAIQASAAPETNDTQTNSGNNLAPAVPPPDGSFVTIADSTFSVTTAGTSFWNVIGVGYNYVRVIYTDLSSGSSTATMSITANIKG